MLNACIIKPKRLEINDLHISNIRDKSRPDVEGGNKRRNQ